MFNSSTIKNCLSGLIGFRQHHNGGYDRYDSDITSSITGQVIDNSAHPLLTVENINAIAEDFSKTDVVAYSNAITYAKGDVIKDVNIIYESLVDGNLNHTPAGSTSQWKATNLLSSFLRRLLNSASINLFNAVFARRKLYEVAKTLLSDTSLYDGVGNLTRKIAKLSRFVAFRIHPRYQDTSINISWAGFQFDTINPSLNLYVYHSSQNEPIKIINMVLTKAISFEWKELSETLTLFANSSAYNNKGFFYIGYYEDDLVGQAIWKEQNFIGSACASCTGLNNYLHKQWGKFIEVAPVYIEEAWLDVGRNLFDETKTIEITNQNWGMNFKIQVNCDVSDVICRNRLAFSEALQKQVIHDLLREMAFSTRINQLKGKVSQMAMLALKGDKEDYSKGAEAELADAVKGVSFDLGSLSKVCLPCEAGGSGVTIGTVF